MSSPYRQDAAAIRERRESLARDLAETDTALAKLTMERGQLVRKLDELEKRLEHAPRFALDMLRVASPCSADWRKMSGDSRVRMCAECNKSVYDISAMTEAEALAFLAKDGDRCVRFYRRADGRVMTSDCPVGVVDRRRRLRILTVASVPLVAATVAGFGAAADARHHTGQIVGGFSSGDVQQGSRYQQGYEMKSRPGADERQPHSALVPDAQVQEGGAPAPVAEPPPR